MNTSLASNPNLGPIMGLLDFFHTMKGEDFLELYFVWLLVIWLGVLLLRSLKMDHPVTTAGGLVLFEGMGVMRYLIGSAHGMHRWGFMVILMGAGAFFFIIRADHFDGFGGWGGGSSGCGHGCSSCGGGGCGGGGCGGGCGGCGGS